MKWIIFGVMACLAWLAIPSKAQQSPCGHFELWQKEIQANPNFKQQHAELEKFTQNFTVEYLKAWNEKQVTVDTPLYIIPVVFHIMHDCGPENISKEQIEDAIRIMNLDFQAQHPDTSAVIPIFKPLVGNCRVEFRLARKDPQGNCTEGITRHQTEKTYGGDEALKSIVQWPPDRYLNIWVENYISLGNAAAYSSLPGMASGTDGIVADYNYVGSIGTANPESAHILSHEAGHFFNLFHTWGLSAGPGLSQNCDIDDGVADTPNTIGSSFTCNTSLSACMPGLIENVQNIMDYSDCKLMFTLGQVARMQAAIQSNLSGRNHLWSAANLLATGTANGFIPGLCRPIATLCNKPVTLCAGQVFTFENLTYGGDSPQFEWWLPGSNQPTSTMANPTVSYSQPGVYDIELTATNAAGSTIFSGAGLVEVLPVVGAELPINESFEADNFPYQFWKTETETGNDWNLSNLAAASGSRSLQHIAAGSDVGRKAVFFTEPYDFTGIGSPFCNFKLAFARKNESIDVLKVYMSTDCDHNWTLRYNKAGSSLATAVDTSDEFIPLASQWRQEGFNVNPAAGSSHVRFRFEFTYRGGQNIYLDDLNVGSLTAVGQKFDNDFQIRVLPNPSDENAWIEIDLSPSVPVSAALFAPDGRCVIAHVVALADQQKQCFTIGRPNSPGIYLLRIEVNGRQFSQKICFK